MIFRINRPRILHEMVENETIIIDFEYGAYYSVRGTANVIWCLIAEQGASRDMIIAHVAAHYVGDRTQMEVAIDAFLAHLQKDELVVEADALGSGMPIPLALPTDAPPRFTPPILEAYTDLQDLLLLDPIHDVGEDEGWPIRKREEETPATAARISHGIE